MQIGVGTTEADRFRAGLFGFVEAAQPDEGERKIGVGRIVTGLQTDGLVAME